MVRSRRRRRLEPWAANEALSTACGRVPAGPFSLHHNGQALGRASHARIEPALAVFAKGPAFVEQHDMVPLRALRLVHRQGIAEIELVRFAPLRIGQAFLGPLEIGRQHADPDRLSARRLVRGQAHAEARAAQAQRLADVKHRAIEQALGLVVAQADQLFADFRHRALEAEQLAQPLVIGAARLVEADQHLIGAGHQFGVNSVARNHPQRAVIAKTQPFAGPHLHRQFDDRIARRLPMHFGQHDVGLLLGEIAAALDRRQLRGVAEHQHFIAEGQKIAAVFLVDHRTFVDDDQATTSNSTNS